MALVKMKPTSAGSRAMVRVVKPDLHKGAPHARLLEKKIRGSGRNNYGRVTTRHQGGGHKQHYRIIDFRRDKDGVPGRIEHLEYDPNRSANIALVLYADGERRYIIAPKGVEAKQRGGAQLGRAAGAGIQLVARDGDYAQLRLRSGEVRKVHVDCRAVIGEVGNAEHSLRKLGKAGASRWRGIRPTGR